VIVIDRRDRIGVPVQCAEYVPEPVVSDVSLGRSYVVQPIRGMRTHLPDGEIKETMLPGFTIHRDRFDQALAKSAAAEGARLMLGTAAVALEEDTVVARSKGGGGHRISATVVIGADGPRSTVAQWIGTGCQDLIAGVQASMKLCSASAFTEVYFDPGFFGGYGWLFPKGEVANVGLGVKKNGGRFQSPKALLMGLARRLTGEGRVEGKPLTFAAGWIPVAPVERLVHRNMVLVGDAAGHTHPITGAGIFSAITGGTMAGKVAAAAVSAGDLELLHGYEAEFRDLFGSTLDRGVKRRRVLEQQWSDLDRIVKSCWIAFREYYDA